MNKEKITVLVIDDEQAILDNLSIRLESEGFGVLSALRGEEGLEIARREKPDLALIDLMMPGMSGFEVCRIMKGDEALREIPIIVLTAKVEREARNGSLALGADAYIAKPYEWKELSEKIKSLLRPGQQE